MEHPGGLRLGGGGLGQAQADLRSAEVVEEVLLILRENLGRPGLGAYLRGGCGAGGAEGGLGQAGAGQQHLTALQQLNAAGIAVSQGSCDEGYNVIFLELGQRRDP